MEHTAKKRACLIGLGMITQRYPAGLEQSDFIQLCAVSDVREDAVSRQHYRDYPFYDNYREMILRERPDYAIISTPPQTHVDIATWCMEQGVNIIIEKPVTLCLEDLDRLTALAETNNLVFKTLFHWHGGVETRAFGQKFDCRKITDIRVSVRDPYCVNGVILPDRRPLMGAWIDSGVNILSMIRLWTPMEACQILGAECRRCPETNLPVYARAELLLDGIHTEITVDWTQGIDKKESFVAVDGQAVHINHSAQTLTTAEGTLDYARMPRMDAHYLYLFSRMDSKPNTGFSRRVHEILFKVNASL